MTARRRAAAANPVVVVSNNCAPTSSIFIDRTHAFGLADRGEPGVNRLNDDRSLADSGGDSLHRARADVTHCEDARQVGLKDVEGYRRIGAAILSCPHESAVVQPHRVFEPSCAGVRTDHDEQAADGPRHHASFAVADLNGSKMFVARELDHLGARLDAHICGMTQALDEVLGHAVQQVATTVDEAHTGGARSEEHGSLARGIASADDHDLLALAGPSLQLGGGVVDTCALETLLLRHSELAIAGSGRDHD